MCQNVEIIIALMVYSCVASHSQDKPDLTAMNAIICFTVISFDVRLAKTLCGMSVTFELNSVKTTNLMHSELIEG